MEFFVTKELELPEALCFILLGLHMLYSGMSYRSKNFKEGVSLVVDSLPLCRSSKRVNSSVRLELCTVFYCTFPRLYYRYMWSRILTCMFFPVVLTNNSYLCIIWYSKLCRCGMVSCCSRLIKWDCACTRLTRLHVISSQPVIFVILLVQSCFQSCLSLSSSFLSSLFSLSCPLYHFTACLNDRKIGRLMGRNSGIYMAYLRENYKTDYL